ncbi:MAG: molybdopterin-dependent oxidoreductase, partial [Chloroflexi bacterium]|nr:molybdopterin-dependent oxidoreductase [Chloroflexota bacterium]
APVTPTAALPGPAASRPQPTHTPDPPPPLPWPPDQQPGRLTPVPDFYAQSYAGKPDLSPGSWRLKIGGMVEQPIELDLAALRSLPAREQMQTLECIGNPSGGRLVGNAVWRGIPLGDLLRQARPGPGATHVQFTAADEYVTSVPLDRALDERSLLAYEMGGEPLPALHGGPARVLLPDVYGQKQPKWPVTLWVVDTYKQGFWEQQGWSDAATLNVNTRIETPGALAELVAGQSLPITGMAFADSSGIRSVEVSVDDGQTWRAAELLPGPNPGVWTLWRWRWENPPAGATALIARSTDGNGRQTVTEGAGVLSGVFPDGTRLAHRIRVTVR